MVIASISWTSVLLFEEFSRVQLLHWNRMLHSSLALLRSSRTYCCIDILCWNSFSTGISKSFNNLLTKHGSVDFSLFFFSRLFFFLLFSWRCWFFTLCLGNVTSSHENIGILCWIYFTTSFFDDPIKLWIVVPSISMHHISQEFT